MGLQDYSWLHKQSSFPGWHTCAGGGGPFFPFLSAAKSRPHLSACFPSFQPKGNIFKEAPKPGTQVESAPSPEHFASSTLRFPPQETVCLSFKVLKLLTPRNPSSRNAS